MTITEELIVVGGGAIGAACARELARSGRKVLVLEPGIDEGAAWRAAAGMLAPQIEAGKDDPLFEMGVAGRQRYSTLAGELLETTGIDIRFWQEGITRLAGEESEVPALRARVAWQRELGHRAEWLEPGEVKERWPWLRENHGALWAPDEAALNPAALVEALLADARVAGARIVTDRVTGIQSRGNRITGLTGNAGTYSAEHVVLAAGAWAPTISGLPRPLPIVPVRGQMAAFPWPTEIHRSIVYGNHVYLVARGGEAIAGSTMENAGFSSNVTPEGIRFVIEGAVDLCPSLAKSEVIRTWAGLRPMTPDGLPMLGREPGMEGLWYAAGHGRNGILLAAISGFLMAELINGRDSPLAPAVRPERFFNW